MNIKTTITKNIVDLCCIFEAFLTRIMRPVLVVYMDYKLRVIDHMAYFRYDMYMYTKNDIGIGPSHVDQTGSYNNEHILKTWINFDLRYLDKK